MNDIEQLIHTLQEKGYSQEQIDTILQGLQDEKDGKLLSAEEVYQSLFATQNTYA